MLEVWIWSSGGFNSWGHQYFDGRQVFLWWTQCINNYHFFCVALRSITRPLVYMCICMSHFAPNWLFNYWIVISQCHSVLRTCAFVLMCVSYVYKVNCWAYRSKSLWTATRETTDAMAVFLRMLTRPFLSWVDSNWNQNMGKIVFLVCLVWMVFQVWR